MDSNHVYEKLELVPVTEDQIDEVHSLWSDAFKWMESQNINQWLAEQCTREAVVYCLENSEMFLAKRNGETVGTFFIVWSDPHLWGDEANNDAGYLHRLVVSRKFTGIGVGFKLLQLAEQYIRDKGKTLFRLDCMAENTKLNTFYRNAGFEYKGRVDGDSWSASLFEKDIQR